MYGDKVIVGYSISNIDNNNKMCLPRYTCCEPGDKLLIIPEDDKLVICSSIVLENYVNKIESINNHKEEVLNTFYRNDLENRILENHTLNELIRNRDDLKL